MAVCRDGRDDVAFRKNERRAIFSDVLVKSGIYTTQYRRDSRLMVARSFAKALTGDTNLQRVYICSRAANVGIYLLGAWGYC